MSDWAGQAADTVENLVGLARDKTVVPARNVAKTLVYGLLIGFIAVCALVLLAYGTFSLVDDYLPGKAWATHLLFGGIFVLAGGFCWTRRNRVSSPDAT
jgi:hypothetical protein